MYSIALLMALTGGNQAVDSHRGGCCGQVASCGCHGGHHHGHRHHGCCGAPVCNTCCGASVCNTCAVPDCGCGAPVPHHEPIKTAPTPKATWSAAPATIVVDLPADAILKVDGEATTSTSNFRVLVSPELPAGKDFQYTLTAQVMRDGKPVQVEQSVAVRAGEESHVSLSLPVTSVAQR
jgi:uncharacterized protein (TIGR03000 family)